MLENNFRKIFLAGVIQGSSQDNSIHSQDYRHRLKALLEEAFPMAEIIDPFDGHENSVEYDDEMGRQTFDKHLSLAVKSDLLVAFLPHASLGTAIEIWESHKHHVPIWVISPMRTNWIIRFCSSRVFNNIDSFASYLRESRARTGVL